MTPSEQFLAWLRAEHEAAGRSLHDGDASGKVATWATEDPVTLFGAFWFEATDARQAREAFLGLAEKFSDCTEFGYDLLAHGVSGDLAYTVGHERASVRVDGVQRRHVLRVTEVYRREGGVWKVVHRHADDATGARDQA